MLLSTLIRVISFYAGVGRESAKEMQERVKRRKTIFDVGRLPLSCDVCYKITHLEIISNWQRAGAALNLTLAEAQGARLVDGKYTITVADHKTGQSCGPAVLCLSQSDGQVFRHYINTVRPLLQSSSQNSDVTHLTSRGKSLNNYIGLLKTLTKRYGLGRLPTITICASIDCIAYCRYIDEMNKLKRKRHGRLTTLN